MYTITYKLKNYADETEYKIQVERHEEACFIHQSLEYCRSLYIVTSRYPSFQAVPKSWSRKQVSEEYNQLVDQFKAAVPSVLHTKDAVERFFRDMEEADNDFDRTLEDFMVLFVQMWHVYQE